MSTKRTVCEKDWSRKSNESENLEENSEEKRARRVKRGAYLKCKQ